MKVGLRTPSIKKSIKARTTGKYKHKLKRQGLQSHRIDNSYYLTGLMILQLSHRIVVKIECANSYKALSLRLKNLYIYQLLL